MKNIKCMELSLYSVIFTFIVLKDKKYENKIHFQNKIIEKKSFSKSIFYRETMISFYINL